MLFICNFERHGKYARKAQAMFCNIAVVDMTRKADFESSIAAL